MASEILGCPEQCGAAGAPGLRHAPLQPHACAPAHDVLPLCLYYGFPWGCMPSQASGQPACASGRVLPVILACLHSTYLVLCIKPWAAVGADLQGRWWARQCDLCNAGLRAIPCTAQAFSGASGAAQLSSVLCGTGRSRSRSGRQWRSMQATMCSSLGFRFSG